MPITIELPAFDIQNSANQQRWAELLNDPLLTKLPGQVETDRYGHIVMSPPARSQHVARQCRIAFCFQTLLPEGVIISECPVSTSDGVKGVDVAWFSLERYRQVKDDVCVSIAPEICVEIISPSNSDRELREKMALYFEAGAKEVWLCLENGEMHYYPEPEASAQKRSSLCPDFPCPIQIPS